ncbi:MAG: hypothetical protein M3342_10435 [Bacteroidota bacterium]|nr:hypothetical protein [Bacteroidota bacterium]
MFKYVFHLIGNGLCHLCLHTVAGKQLFKEGVHPLRTSVALASFGSALVVPQSFCFDYVAGEGCSTVFAFNEYFQRYGLLFFFMRHAIVRGCSMQVIDLQEEFFRDKLFMCAFYYPAVQHTMIDDATIEGPLKDFGELLLVHLQSHCSELQHNFFIFHALCLPFKSFSELFAFFIHHNLPHPIYFNDVIALGNACDPLAFFKLLFHAGYGSLLAQLVIKLREQKLNVLVQHTTGMGSVGGLRYSKYRHTVLFS